MRGKEMEKKRIRSRKRMVSELLAKKFLTNLTNLILCNTNTSYDVNIVTPSPPPKKEPKTKT